MTILNRLLTTHFHFSICTYNKGIHMYTCTSQERPLCGVESVDIPFYLNGNLCQGQLTPPQRTFVVCELPIAKVIIFNQKGAVGGVCTPAMQWISANTGQKYAHMGQPTSRISSHLNGYLLCNCMQSTVLNTRLQLFRDDFLVFFEGSLSPSTLYCLKYSNIYGK